MDYKKLAMELLDISLGLCVEYDDIKSFNYLCKKYQSLNDELLLEWHEKIKDVPLPTEEQRKRLDEELYRRIQEYNEKHPK